MDIQGTIDKLLLALSQRGDLYKINSFKFYSNKNNKYCTKYQILKRIIIVTDDDEKIEKYVIDDEVFKKVDVLLYLLKEYKES